MMVKRDLSQRELAKGLSVTPSAVNRWVNGDAIPDTASCERLANFFEEPLEKIYAMAGHPVSSSYKPPPERQRSLRDQALELLADLPVAVPVYEQRASAGFGQEVLDWVYLEPGHETDGRYIAIRVRGTSMEPDLEDGDLIIMDTQASPEIGEMVVATIGDQIYVKEYRERRGHVILVGNTGEIPADDAKIEGVLIQKTQYMRRRRRR